MLRFDLKMISGSSLVLFNFQKVFKLFRLITEIATEIANIQVSSFYSLYITIYTISYQFDYLLYAYHHHFHIYHIHMYIISLYNEYIIFNYHINIQHFIQYHIKPLRNSTMFHSQL